MCRRPVPRHAQLAASMLLPYIAVSVLALLPRALPNGHACMRQVEGEKGRRGCAHPILLLRISGSGMRRAAARLSCPASAGIRDFRGS
jgi:hypothetical protein